MLVYKVRYNACLQSTKYNASQQSIIPVTKYNVGLQSKMHVYLLYYSLPVCIFSEVYFSAICILINKFSASLPILYQSTNSLPVCQLYSNLQIIC